MRYLIFDFSDGDDGIASFEAMASTRADEHAAVLAEARQVLDWAHRHFPGRHGPVEDGNAWDHELLTQLFANLVENAARHGPPGTHIKLAGYRVGEAVEVAVADNGPGIPPAQRDKVLRRFHRLDVSRTTPGNGLGLSLAQAVAGLHDTRLELADNEPGLRVVLRFAGASAHRPT